MYRALVAAGLLSVAFGDSGAAVQKPAADVASTVASSTSAQQQHQQHAQHQQREQHQQHQQVQQKQQKNWMNYVKEYVPAAYEKQAIKDDKDDKDSSSQKTEKKSASKGAGSAVDLLSLGSIEDSLTGPGSQSDGAAHKTAAASTVASNTKKSTSQVASSSNANQQQQGQQHQQRQQRQQREQTEQTEQTEQAEQPQQKNWMNYVKEYVPAAYQKEAVKDDKDDKDSSTAKAADSHKAQSSEKKSDAGSAGSAIDLLSKKGSDSPADKYTHEYAGEYQKYIHGYHNREQQDAVHSAHDAQNKTQLDAWRASEKQSVKWYVPAEYAHYANRNVDDKYKARLNELQHRKQSTSVSHLTEVESIIDLDAVPAHKDHKEHLNATQRKALRKAQCEQLRETSNDTVKKVERMSESLKKAARDETALDETAARPVQNVVSAFSTTSQALDQSVDQLQKEMKSGQVSADFENRLAQTKQEVKTLRGDELNALDQAHRDAGRASNHAARGAESEAREDARKVEAMTDHMARKDRSYQDMTDKLQNDVEVATDGVESHAEDLASRTQDRLDSHVSKAREVIHKQTESQLDALTEVEGQFQEMQAETAKAAKEKKEKAATEHKKSEAFLAQPIDFSPAPLSALALVAVSFACVSFWLFTKRSRTVELPQNVLG